MNNFFQKPMSFELFAAFLDNNLSDIEKEDIQRQIEKEAMLSDIYEASQITDEIVQTDGYCEVIDNKEFDYHNVEIPRLDSHGINSILNQDNLFTTEFDIFEVESLPLVESEVEGLCMAEHYDDDVQDEIDDDDSEDDSDEGFNDDLTEE